MLFMVFAIVLFAAVAVGGVAFFIFSRGVADELVDMRQNTDQGSSAALVGTAVRMDIVGSSYSR